MPTNYYPLNHQPLSHLIFFPFPSTFDPSPALQHPEAPEPEEAGDTEGKVVESEPREEGLREG